MIAALVDGAFASRPVVCLALAYGIAYGLLGYMDLTVWVRMTVAGYAGWLTVEQLHVATHPAFAPQLWLAAIVGSVVCGALAWALLAPLQRGSELALLIGSLGLSYAASGALQGLFGTAPRVFTTYPVESGIPILGTTATPLQLCAAAYAAAATLVVALILHATRFGTKLEVIATNPEVAQTVFGLRKGRLAWAAMTLVSVIVAPAGLLLAIGGGVTPLTGFQQGLLAFVATITAGRRRPLAAPLVALLFVCVGSAAIRWTAFDLSLVATCAATAAVVYLVLIRKLPMYRWRKAFALALAAATLPVAAVLAAAFGAPAQGGLWGAQLPAAFQPIVPYAVAVAALLWRPRGVLALRSERVV